MGTITSGIGLVSGINSSQIIDQLMALEARPKTMLESRIQQANQKKLAYTDLSTRLTALKLSATTLKKPTTFAAAGVVSSNENVLTATAASGAARGTFSFQVSRLVTAQQAISSTGLASATTKVGAGTLTIEQGGGEIFSTTQLAHLNGGNGVQRGSFRITDRSGRSGTVDISGAFTLDDVVRRINTSLDFSIKASIVGNSIQLADLSGQTTSNLIVTDLGGGTSAVDLGIAGSFASSNHTGSSINHLGRSTLLSTLNDGLGIRRNAASPDFRITARDGQTFDVTLGSASTVGAVLDTINTATGGVVAAFADPGSTGLRLVDNTAGGGNLSIAALNSSKAAEDLGIETSVAVSQIDGSQVLASINTVLLSSLRGGAGLSLGTVTITDRAGVGDTFDFTTARTVQDILDRINASPIGVTARLKESGNGIELIDGSGGAGLLMVNDGSSSTAAELGIAGAFGLAVSSVKGANLQRQWAGENTLLSAYNGGRGVGPGKIRITNSNGVGVTVDLTTGVTTLGDVISKINTAAATINVTASINAKGDGLLITDNAGGGVKLKIENVEGRTADELNIDGEATGTTIDGSFEKTVTLDAADTLESAISDINALGFGLSASLVNDGSGENPFRLSLVARDTGRAGRFVFDAGATALQTRTLVESQDAVVFYGGADASNPLVITSNTNQLKDIVKGVTIDLHSTSTAPVTLSVSANIDSVVSEIKKFSDNFNQLVDKIRTFTDFNTETNVRGVLLGESAIQRVESEIYSVFQRVIKDAGRYSTFNQLGLRAGAGAKLEFDETKFRDAYAEDSESVKKFFTLFEKSVGSSVVDKKGMATLAEEAINKLTDPVSGVITRQNKQLDDKTEQFQDRISQIDKLLEAKRARLVRQFAQMESVLASLQSQQSAISSFQPVQPLRPRTN